MSPDLPFSHPRERALLALQWAGFDLSALDDDFLTTDRDLGFDLSFEAGTDRRLVLSWDEGLPEWLIRGEFDFVGPKAAALMLELSPLLPRGLRFSADAALQRIELCTELPDSPCSTDELALAIVDITKWLHLAADAAGRQAIDEARSAATERVTASSLQSGLPSWAIRG
jgi:hypothetical protein